MKKLFFIFYLMFLSFILFGQSSFNGYQLSPNGTIRVFLVFAEQTGTSDYNDYQQGWLPGQMPDDANNYFDADFTGVNNISGYLTDYFYQMSFGNFIVLGDYYSPASVRCFPPDCETKLI